LPAGNPAARRAVSRSGASRTISRAGTDGALFTVVDEEKPPLSPSEAAWQGVSAAFAALGRVFICLDDQYRVIHASMTLDDILGPGAARAAEQRPIAELLGLDLFGPSGIMRIALEAGERREGWRAHLRLDAGESHVVSVSTAPFPRQLFTACDVRVKAVVVVRPADEDRDAAFGAPTAVAGIVARSAAMLRIISLIENLSHSDATVLLTGESGTGKEVVARALHERSPRHAGPFVPVNCGALPADLLESEMFGHVRGSFTGAVRDRVGRFDLAAGGTLFLDEVGDLPLPLQVKLLRVLQDGTFERVGESTSRTSRARIIAATNVDLRTAVANGRFRDDLYYRLRVVPIEIPPLRERREDVEPLANALLARVSAHQGRSLRLSADAMRRLLDYDWPGNARELENALEYAVAVCRGQTILPEDLPDLASVRTPAVSAAARPHASERSVDAPLRAALEAHHWRRSDAARSLGISRSTLWRRMREAGLI
jgi:transcriptional regulator with PAS, ATPase and Fis domain